MKVLKKISLLSILLLNYLVLLGQSVKDYNSSCPSSINQTYRYYPAKFKIEQLHLYLGNHMAQKINTDQWPLFCKWEEKWRQKSNLPIKFRLGSIDYVDFPENK